MDIQIFNHPQFGDIRCMKDERGDPWFVGKDVASVLGYSNTRDAISKHVDEDDKTTVAICDTGSKYRSQAVIINESGLYSLVLSSKLPQAKVFKRWVTGVVLPQIRKTGGYINVNDKDDENTILAKALMIAHKTIEQKTSLLEAQRPLVEFAEALDASVGCVDVAAMANLLKQNGYDTGRRRLFKKLRELNYICKFSRRPLQKSIDAGLFEVKVTLWKDGEGKDHEDVKPMVTPKGQKYFIELFCKTD